MGAYQRGAAGLLAAALLGAAAACGGVTPRPAATPTPTPSPSATASPSASPAPSATPGSLDEALRASSVPFRSLARQQHLFQGDTAESALFRSQADADAFVARHPLNGSPPPPLPAVDFAAEQGVMVLLGPQSTGAITVEIVAIEEQADRYLVRAVRWLPPADAVTTADIGYPCHYVAMARSDKPVAFAPVVDGDASRRPAR